jgi:hypothetical protein
MVWFVQEIVRAVISLNNKIDAIQMPTVCINYYSMQVKVPSVSHLLVSMFFIFIEGLELHNQWKAPDEPTHHPPNTSDIQKKNYSNKYDIQIKEKE